MFPPTLSSSIRVTSAPNWAERIAATYPPGPPPIMVIFTISSKSPYPIHRLHRFTQIIKALHPPIHPFILIIHPLNSTIFISLHFRSPASCIVNPVSCILHPLISQIFITKKYLFQSNYEYNLRISCKTKINLTISVIIVYHYLI